MGLRDVPKEPRYDLQWQVELSLKLTNSHILIVAVVDFSCICDSLKSIYQGNEKRISEIVGDLSPKVIS